MGFSHGCLKHPLVIINHVCVPCKMTGASIRSTYTNNFCAVRFIGRNMSSLPYLKQNWDELATGQAGSLPWTAAGSIYMGCGQWASQWLFEASIGFWASAMRYHFLTGLIATWAIIDVCLGVRFAFPIWEYTWTCCPASCSAMLPIFIIASLLWFLDFFWIGCTLHKVWSIDLPFALKGDRGCLLVAPGSVR